VSILSDRDIAKAIDRGEIAFSGGNESWRWQPSSLEVTLGGWDGALRGYPRELVEYRKSKPEYKGFIDPENPPSMSIRSWWTQETTGRRFYTLAPGEFVLGCTEERLRLSDSMAAALEGKSSLGRLGLLVHCTARYIDPGWDGLLTLELKNVAPRPLRLWAGMRIGQVRFERLSSPAERPYGAEGLESHYQGSLGTVQADSVAPRASQTTEEEFTLLGADGKLHSHHLPYVGG
jgi:dCTP deaminase